jgi:hypothetical protein
LRGKMADVAHAFPFVRIEGGLFGPDLLEALASAGLPGQKPADFGLADRCASICARGWKSV